MPHPLLTWRLPFALLAELFDIGICHSIFAQTAIRSTNFRGLARGCGRGFTTWKTIGRSCLECDHGSNTSPQTGLALRFFLGFSGLCWLTVAEGAATVLAVLVLSMGRAPMGPVVDALSLQALGSAQRGLRTTETLGLHRLYRRCTRLRLHLVWTRHIPVGFWNYPLNPPHSIGFGDANGAQCFQFHSDYASLAGLGWRPIVVVVVTGCRLALCRTRWVNKFLAVHLKALGYPEHWTGIILTMGVGVEIVLMSRSRALLKRFSPSRIFLAAMLVATPRWLLTAMVGNAWLLLLLQAGHGFTFGAFWLAGVAVVSSRAPEGVETSAQGLFAASVGGVGAMIGMVGASLIVDHFPTHHLFLWGAGAGSLAICAAWLGLRRMNTSLPQDNLQRS